VTVRPALFSADALLLKTFAARRLPRNDLPGEVSLLRGELALPLSGGTRQPLDRQVSYYSELLRLASELRGSPASCPDGRRPQNTPKRKKRHSEQSGAPL